MKVNKVLIIPDYNQIERSLAVAKAYDCGFEYNDFYLPDFLDDETSCKERILYYRSLQEVPDCCTMHGAFLDVNVASDDPKMAEVSDYRIEESIRIARALGTGGVVFHTNFIPNFHMDYYRTNWVERNAKYWADKLKKYPDTDIYIENMFDTSWDLLAMLAEKLKEYPNFGVCFDFAHAHAFGNAEEIAHWVKALAPYVKHIHINDNDLEKDLHLPLGEGKIDWSYFKEVYENYFPQATVLIEMKDLNAAEQSLQFLRNL
nr:TIM barrel protein [Lachnospiraceae bacterium]